MPCASMIYVFRMAVFHSYVEFSMAMLDCQMVLNGERLGKGCFDRRTDRNPGFIGGRP